MVGGLLLSSAIGEFSPSLSLRMVDQKKLFGGYLVGLLSTRPFRFAEKNDFQNETHFPTRRNKWKMNSVIFGSGRNERDPKKKTLKNNMFGVFFVLKIQKNQQKTIEFIS